MKSCTADGSTDSVPPVRSLPYRRGGGGIVSNKLTVTNHPAHVNGFVADKQYSSFKPEFRSDV